jgi:oligosaccharide repeat unit polymerase
MIYALLNALLYIGLLIWYKRKYHKIDCGFLMISLWTFVAICNFFFYLSVPKEFHLQLWPFLYLFGAFFLYNRLFFKSEKEVLNVTVFTDGQNKVIDYICYFYVFCLVVNMFSADYSLSSLSLSSVQENAADSYMEYHAADKWHSQTLLERITMNYAVWFFNVAIIGAFSWIVRGKTGRGVALLGLLILDQGLKSIQIASRGSLFFVVLLFVAVYLIYKDYIPRKAKKSLKQLALVSGGVLALYMLAITISRFGDMDKGGSDSLFEYFGHSMLTFNYGVADSLDRTFMGSRTFRNIIGLSEDFLFDADAMLGTHFGSGFTTTIGMLCLDFGFLGTLALGVALPWLLLRLIKLDNSIGGVFVYVFYFHRMMNGVFVNGSGADSAYISMLIVYVVLFVSMKFMGKGKKSRTKSKPVVYNEA